MTDTSKVPVDAPKVNASAVDDIVEVIFEDHYALAVAAFIAGAIVVAALIYMIGSRNIASEGEHDA